MTVIDHSVTNYSDLDVEPLDDRASAELFDQVAQRHMGISGDTFIAHWDRGDYEGKDWDSQPGLVEVAMALPFARR